jgi:CBS domain-containing protein
MPTLKELMTGDVFTTSPATPVADVVGSMLRKRVGSALVMEGSVLVGIFTERDVMRAAAAGTDLQSAPVVEWMTEDPVTAGPDLEADDATEIMMSQGFRHLPVLVGGNVAGIVSLRDLMRHRVRRSHP